jgi:hypothetical protein
MKRTVWQDYVLMIGGFIFIPSTLISVIEGARIPILTSLPTALVLTSFVGCYLTLKLKLAALASFLTALCWYTLFFMEVL